MGYQIIKLFIYIVSVMLAMIGLSCFNFDHVVLKGKVAQFYVFFFMASIVLGYLFASFVLEFMTISI